MKSNLSFFVLLAIALTTTTQAFGFLELDHIDLNNVAWEYTKNDCANRIALWKQTALKLNEKPYECLDVYDHDAGQNSLVSRFYGAIPFGSTDREVQLNGCVEMLGCVGDKIRSEDKELGENDTFIIVGFKWNGTLVTSLPTQDLRKTPIQLIDDRILIDTHHSIFQKIYNVSRCPNCSTSPLKIGTKIKIWSFPSASSNQPVYDRPGQIIGYAGDHYVVRMKDGSFDSVPVLNKPQVFQVSK